jgi:uncharacterized protein (DUF4213/DUF364 family)
MRALNSTLQEAKVKFVQIATTKDLLDAEAAVSVTPLTAEEAIGHPSRRDFPIVEGKERVVEATFRGAKAHAFTDSPRDFKGTLRDVLALDLSTNQNRAVFIAVLNAALRSLGRIETSLHCRDDDPEKCAKELASRLRNKWGKVVVGLVGFNPAIAEALVESFGVDKVCISDLNRKNVQTVKFGVTIWDGKGQTEELIRQSDAVLVTGTTLVNGTFDGIWGWVQSYGSEYVIYGVTGAGVCELMNWNRMCPYSRSS